MDITTTSALTVDASVTTKWFGAEPEWFHYLIKQSDPKKRYLLYKDNKSYDYSLSRTCGRGYTYTSFSSQRERMDYVTSHPNDSLYECITGREEQCKLYFDIDYTVPFSERSTSEEKIRKYLSDFCKALRSTFNEGGLPFCADDMRIYKSSGVTGDMWKNSYHIVVVTYFVCSASHHKALCHYIYDKVEVLYPESYVLEVDERGEPKKKWWGDRNVYRNDGSSAQFRIYGSSKVGANRPKKIYREEGCREDQYSYWYDGACYHQTIPTAWGRANVDYEQLFVESLITSKPYMYNGVSRIPDLVTLHPCLSEGRKSNEDSKNGDVTKAFELFLEQYPQYHGQFIQGSDNRLTRVGGGPCHCGKVHDGTNGAYINFSGGGRFAKFRCAVAPLGTPSLKIDMGYASPFETSTTDEEEASETFPAMTPAHFDLIGAQKRHENKFEPLGWLANQANQPSQANQDFAPSEENEDEDSTNDTGNESGVNAPTKMSPQVWQPQQAQSEDEYYIQRGLNSPHVRTAFREAWNIPKNFVKPVTGLNSVLPSPLMLNGSTVEEQTESLVEALVFLTDTVTRHYKLYRNKVVVFVNREPVPEYTIVVNYAMGPSGAVSCLRISLAHLLSGSWFYDKTLPFEPQSSEQKTRRQNSITLFWSYIPYYPVTTCNAPYFRGCPAPLIGTADTHRSVIVNTSSGYAANPFRFGLRSFQEWSQDSRVQGFLHLVKGGFCRSNTEEFVAFMNFLSHSLKHGYDPRTHKAYLAIGPQQIGKTLLGVIMIRVFGLDLAVAPRENEVTGDMFNSIIENRVFIHIDEPSHKSGSTGYGRTNIQKVERMKDAITREYHPIRRMHTDSYVVKALENYYITSNYFDVGLFDEDDRRRYVVLDVRTSGYDVAINKFIFGDDYDMTSCFDIEGKPIVVENPTVARDFFFQALTREIDHPDFIDAWAATLYAWASEHDTFSIRNYRQDPNNTARSKLTEGGKEPHRLFIDEVFNDEYTPFCPNFFLEHNGSNYISWSDFHTEYGRWIEKKKYKVRDMSESAFMRQMIEYLSKPEFRNRWFRVTGDNRPRINGVRRGAGMWFQATIVKNGHVASQGNEAPKSTGSLPTQPTQPMVNIQSVTTPNSLAKEPTYNIIPADQPLIVSQILEIQRQMQETFQKQLAETQRQMAETQRQMAETFQKQLAEIMKRPNT